MCTCMCCVQAARMQKAKKDAAKNWRATLSGDGAQIKNEMDRVDDGNREHEGGVAKEQGQVGDPQSAMGVQERAMKDRLVIVFCCMCRLSLVDELAVLKCDQLVVNML